MTFKKSHLKFFQSGLILLLMAVISACTTPPPKQGPKPASVQSGRTIEAGPIWNNNMAQNVCPRICHQNNMNWSGQWWTTVPGRMSVCHCNPRGHHGGGMAPKVRKFVLEYPVGQRHFRGDNTIGIRRELRRQHGINPQNFRIKAIKVVAKSKHGGGLAYFSVGPNETMDKYINGRPNAFHRPGGFHRIRFANPGQGSRGPWQLHMQGNIKVKKIVVKLVKKRF